MEESKGNFIFSLFIETNRKFDELKRMIHNSDYFNKSGIDNLEEIKEIWDKEDSSSSLSRNYQDYTSEKALKQPLE